MITYLKWKKKIFSNLLSIYSNKQKVGELKNKCFSESAQGELNGKKYIFKTKGVFKQHTEIIDGEDNEVIGTITYNSWKSKATVSIGEKTLNWEYSNFWHTKWSVYNSNCLSIRYSASCSHGQIDSGTDDPLIILSGLYVSNYYSQTIMQVFLLVLIPLWIS